MYKILFVFILFFNLSYQCSVSPLILTNNITICRTYTETQKSCASNLIGSVLFNNIGEEICISIQYLNNILGTLKMKLTNIRFFPSCEVLYWTSSFDYVKASFQDATIIEPLFFKVEEYCRDSVNTGRHTEKICICYRECYDDNDKTLLNKDCWGMFQNDNNFKNYKDFFLKNMTKMGCSNNIGAPGLLYHSFHNVLPLLNKKRMYQLQNCGGQGDFFIEIEMSFNNTRGLNESTFLKDKFFPSTPTKITFKTNQVNNQIFGGFNFFKDSFGLKGNSINPTKYLVPIPMVSDTNCYYVANNLPKNIPNSVGIGEYQTYNEQSLLKGYDSVFIRMFHTNVNFLDDGKQKLYTDLIRIIKNPDFTITNGQHYTKVELTEAFLNNIPLHDQVIHILPHYSLPTLYYKCSKNRIYADYSGSFDYTLFFKTTDPFIFIIETNEVKPLITDCSILGGFKNSLLGSFIVIKAKSQSSKGLGKINILYDDGLIANVLTDESIILTTIEQEYNISFRINNPKSLVVNITIILIGSEGNQGLCFHTYIPIDSHPDFTHQEIEPFNPTPPPSCNLILNICFLDFFDWIIKFLFSTDFLNVIIKIIIIILIGLIIFLIIYCILNRPQNPLSFFPLPQQSNQPNITINIPPTNQ